MSVINKKPLIEKVVSALSPEQKKNLLKGLNGELTKSVKVFDNLSTSDKGISYVDIKFADGVKTGYLVYNDAVSVLIAYYNDTQKMTLFVLDVTKHTYKASREYLTIDELRRIVGLELVEVGENIKIQVGDIDSGSQASNKIIVSDGEGGASWGSVIDVIENADVQDGSAQYLIGIDSNGDVVKDEIPEGIVVDQTIIEDSTNAVSGGAVYDALELKANSSDVYTKTATDELLDDKASITALENGTIVPAKSLVSEQLENVSEDSGTTQDAPFLFQATATDGGGGASDTAPTAKYLKLKGNSIAWNQLVQNGNFETGTGWIVENGTKSVANNILTATANANNQLDIYSAPISMISGHKYLLKFTLKNSDNGHLWVSLLNGETYSQILAIQSIISLNTTKQTKGYVFTCPQTAGGRIFIYSYEKTDLSGGETTEFSNVQLFDLTQMYGGNDNIPTAILNGVELSDYDLSFSGVDIFNQLYPLPYYAHDEGSLKSANATLLTTLGKNQFDGELRQGATQIGNTNAKVISSVNPIKVIPGQTYRIETTGFSSLNQSGVYIKEYASLEDITNNVVLKTTNQNAPFNISLQSNTHYVLLQFNFSVDTAPTSSNVGKACFFLAWLENGTTSRPDYEEYIKHEYQLGSELKDNPLLSAGNVCDEKTPDGIITRRVGVETLDANKSIGDTITISGIKSDTQNIISNHGALTEWGTISGTTITLTKALSVGDTIQYELATPITIQGTPFPAIVEVDDMGTMGHGGTSYNGYPQGCEFFYPADYVLFIDSLGNTCDFDASKIALKSDVSAEETARTNYDTILQNAIGGTLRHQLADKVNIDFLNTAWVDLGTLSWNKSGSKMYAFISNRAQSVGYNSTIQLLCTLYKSVGNVNIADAMSDKTICFVHNETEYIQVYDTAYSDATAFKNAMKGVLLAYEKA